MAAGRRLLTVVLFGAILSGCGGQTATPSLRSSLRACTLGTTAAMCGTMAVPEDPSKPSGRTIQLAVAVIPAIESKPAPDPFFMLVGGPGGAATQGLSWAPAAYPDIHHSRDIVLVDQRGTGGSNRLVLPATPDWSGLSADERKSRARAWASEQLGKLNADVTQYTTSVAMDDVDAVRAALGYDKIDLWGASYGATAAQYYMRQHGDHLRSVVLDGSTLVDVPIFAVVAKNTARSLDGVLARCAAEPTCHDAFPDVKAEFTTLMERLSAKPATVTVGAATATIDAGTVASAIQSLLLNADDASKIPLLIHLANAGRWDAVLAVKPAGSGGNGEQLVMDLEIRCSEAWARMDTNEIARLSEGSWQEPFQLVWAERQAETCALVPKGRVPANDAEPVRSDVPVLLTVGDLDPQDPPSNIADAPLELPNSVTLVVPGHGHTVSTLGCVPRIIEEFVAAGTAKGLDTSCVAKGGVPIPQFVVAVPQSGS